MVERQKNTNGINSPTVPQEKRVVPLLMVWMSRCGGRHGDRWWGRRKMNQKLVNQSSWCLCSDHNQMRSLISKFHLCISGAQMKVVINFQFPFGASCSENLYFYLNSSLNILSFTFENKIAGPKWSLQKFKILFVKAWECVWEGENCLCATYHHIRCLLSAGRFI